MGKTVRRKGKLYPLSIARCNVEQSGRWTPVSETPGDEADGRLFPRLKLYYKAMPPVPQECLMRWTVQDVRRMIDAGGFERPERFELVEGLILEKMGQNEPHIMSVLLATRAFRAVYGLHEDVVAGIPVRISDASEPEPDLVVMRTRLTRPPTAADCLVVVEVSDTSLGKDQTTKAALYARHAIPEYVILDVTSRRAEIRRRPNPERETWGETLILDEGGEFAPLGASGAVRVADLFGEF